MRRIAFATGSRSEYGLLEPVIRACRSAPGLDVDIFATGVHLLARFGRSIDAIEGPIAAEIEMYPESGPASPEVVPGSLARGIRGFGRAFAKRRPDILTVLGDRTEALAAVLAAAPLGIAIAHIHGGDQSEGGHIDESTRGAITRFAHIHLAATGRSAERLRRMGEEAWRIHTIGAPGVDSIRSLRLRPHDDVARALGLDPPEPFALLVHHPHTVGWEQAGEETERIVQALAAIGTDPRAARGLAVAAVYPNGDPGSPAIIEVLRRAEGPRFRVFPNLPRALFVEAMARAALVIGNSSAAIIEGPALGAPAVNVGERNRTREHGANVVFAPAEPAALRDAIRRALDPTFRARAESAPSPYGDGGAGPRAARILSQIPIDRRLIAKRWDL